MSRRLTLPVDEESTFAELGLTRRPFGRSVVGTTHHLLRETYFDTTDGVLHDHRMRLVVRLHASGTQTAELVVTDGVNLSGIVDESLFEQPLEGGGLYAALAGASELATRVRAVVEPDALRPQLALDVDRVTKELKSGLFGRSTHRVSFDEIIAHAVGSSRTYREVTLQELSPGGAGLESMAAWVSRRYGLEGDGLSTYERTKRLLTEGEGGPRVDVAHDVRIALLLLHGWNVALVDSEGGLTLPGTRGSGEDFVREYLGEVLGPAGSDTHELDLVGFATPRKATHDLEVWLHEVSSVGERPGGFVWVPLLELFERIGGPRLRDPGLVATLLMFVRSDTGMRILREAPARRSSPLPLPLAGRPADVPPGTHADDFLDLDLSVLDFNVRVLEMAEDPTTPLLERLKFLSIFTSNMDEFFVVRVARLKDEIGRGIADDKEDLSPAQLLGLVLIRARALLARQYACFTQQLLPELAKHGVHLRRWNQLQAGQRAALTRKFQDEIFPVLTPLKLSASAVRSFPRLVSMGLALAAVLRRPGEARTDLGSPGTELEFAL